MLVPERFVTFPPHLAEVREWQHRCEVALAARVSDDEEPELPIPLDLLLQLLVFAEVGLRFPTLLLEAGR